MYKSKKIFLISLIMVLSLLYAGSFIFDSERNDARSASYVWLDSKLAGKTTRITINSEWETIELVKTGNNWVVSQTEVVPSFLLDIFGDDFAMPAGRQYPARYKRIEDFLSIFTTKAPWPVRSSGASSHSRFGLADDTALRVTVFAQDTVILDLMMGDNEVSDSLYLRRYGQDEVRSGGEMLYPYIGSPASSWYNLRLIPESEDGVIDIDSVQRLTVNNDGETLIFTRQNRGWVVSGEYVEDPDFSVIDNYVRTVLNIEGDDFLEDIEAADPMFNHSRIVIEFGNGSIKTIRISAPDEMNKRVAQISGSDFIYSIPLWVSIRVFRGASSFERQ